MLPPAPLRTARLLLRPYAPADAPDFYALLAAEGPRLEPAFPRRVAAVRTLADAERTLQTFAGQWGQRRLLVWGIWHRASGHYLGDISLQPDTPRIRGGEIGYYLGAGAEGQGYAREALGAVVDFAFAHLGTRLLTLRCRPENVRSQATAVALGFQRTGPEEPGIWHYALQRTDFF
ncbi:GNAT family N-acetyltransferase [Hymenobacter coalescens]